MTYTEPQQVEFVLQMARKWHMVNLLFGVIIAVIIIDAVIAYIGLAHDTVSLLDRIPMLLLIAAPVGGVLMEAVLAFFY